MLPSRKRYAVPLPDGRTLALGDRTLVMGIINVTPDSFADGGLRLDPRAAIDAAVQMEAEGADLLDIGGESTRPGAEPVGADTEIERILPVLRGLAGRVRLPISVDTYKSEVARAALDAGAVMINDVSGLRYDPALARLAAERKAGLILMHNRGRARDMYREATYDDVAVEVANELAISMNAAVGAGVAREAIVLDPGLGFAKRAEHSYTVLGHLEPLARLDRPLLLGPSRKSFLQAAIGDTVAAQRDWATAAAVTAAVLFGAHIVRVHAVRQMVDVVRVADRLRAACMPG